MDHLNFDSSQFIVNEDIKKEDNLSENSTNQESINQECVVCIKESCVIYDIFSTYTFTLRTPIHTFLSRFTNTDLLCHPNLVKYICRTCYNLVNILEQAEMEYQKLKESFESIIRQNPLFSLPERVQLSSVKAEPRDSDDDDDETLNRSDDSEKDASGVKDVDPIPEDAAQLVMNDKNEGPDDGQNPLFSLPEQVQLSSVKTEPTDSDDDDDETLNRSDDSERDASGVKDVDPIPEDAAQLVMNDKNEGPNDGEQSSNLNAVVKMEPMSEDELEPASSLCVTELKTVECTKRTRGRARKSKPQKIQIEDPEKKPEKQREKPTGERPYGCTVCQRRFMLKHHLKDHMKIHTGEKPHECHICAYRSSRKDDFIRHFRTHTGEKPYQCGVCKSCFKLKSHLREHERTHTGEKPYECHICQRRFNYRHVLKSHCRTHTSEKPYECHICQRRFNQRSHLKSHVKIHTGEKPYECTICLMRFNRKTSLKEHTMTHSDEKPFECEICHHRYNQKGNLMKHLRMHAVGKAFACHLCERRFYYNHALVKHLKSHNEQDRRLVVEYQQNSDSHSHQDAASDPVHTQPVEDVKNGATSSKDLPN